MPKPIEVMPVEFDPTKPPYKQPKGPAKPSEEEPKAVPELEEISPEELKHILEVHKKWVDSEEKEGEPANLAERMRELRNQANDLSSHLHRLSYELHPSMITHLGLVAAVRSLSAVNVTVRAGTPTGVSLT